MLQLELLVSHLARASLLFRYWRSKQMLPHDKLRPSA
jgi:hypothetical protein